MPDLAPELRALVDRQAIFDCILRYCRGVDRFDRELVRSCYHADAIDDHGGYCGPVEGFIDWAFGVHQHSHLSTFHSVHNHSCELAGDVAHTETYFQFVGNNREGPVSLHFGRYLDRFERRDGRWAIAARVCSVEIGGALGPDPTPPEFVRAMKNCVTARDRTDVSYHRPLMTRQAHPRAGSE